MVCYTVHLIYVLSFREVTFHSFEKLKGIVSRPEAGVREAVLGRATYRSPSLGMGQSPLCAGPWESRTREEGP